MSACWAAGSGAARELGRQASDYNVQALKFVPWGQTQLVSCGKNSIRMYRWGGKGGAADLPLVACRLHISSCM